MTDKYATATRCTTEYLHDMACYDAKNTVIEPMRPAMPARTVVKDGDDLLATHSEYVGREWTCAVARVLWRKHIECTSKNGDVLVGKELRYKTDLKKSNR